MNLKTTVQPRMDTDEHGLGRVLRAKPFTQKLNRLVASHPCVSVSIRGFIIFNCRI